LKEASQTFLEQISQSMEIALVGVPASFTSGERSFLV